MYEFFSVFGIYGGFYAIFGDCYGICCFFILSVLVVLVYVVVVVMVSMAGL